MSFSIDSLVGKIKKNNILIVIGGPTASGKTSLAVAIANLLGGQIISADSRQVYKGMDIGSGKDLGEYTINKKQINYHCIDVVKPSVVFTLADFLKEANLALKKIIDNNDIPILCGGTGLYIESFLKGYQIPAVKEDVALRCELENFSKEELTLKLKNLSPTLFDKTDLSSKKRIIRSIEIATHSTSTATTNNFCTPQNSFTASSMVPLFIVTDFEKEELISRIDSRVDKRLKEGMIEEVEKLIEGGISLGRLTQLGMEYGVIGKYLFKELTYEDMVTTLKHNIHRLAKRQRTWFRGTSRRGIKTHYISGNSLEAALDVITNFTNQF